MSAILDFALDLASQNVKLFPVTPNSKTPAVSDFSHKATSDVAELTRLFEHSHLNSGIACGFVSEGLYLVGFDIDKKDGRDGELTLEKLAAEGKTFPETWTQKTPSGGYHFLFWSPVPIRQGVDVCGPGIDLRGDGGYLVGPGSKIDGAYYEVLRSCSIAPFPEWAVNEYQKTATVVRLSQDTSRLAAKDQILALKRSVEYLKSLPITPKGGRNHKGYEVINRLKDFGLAKDQIPGVLLEHWACEPMINMGEVNSLINSAFKYGQNPPAVDAPENIFEVVPAPKDPIDELNKDHFYFAGNGVSKVCWETTRDGRFHLERYPVYIFHEDREGETILEDGKFKQLTKVWMKSDRRRSYKFIRFNPNDKCEPNTYNLWRGFFVKPLTKDALPSAEGKKAVDDFLEHCLANICGGDEELCKWLLGFFAHMFQYPGEKPQVSLVFKGGKGTGKTFTCEILNYLIGDCGVILADKSHIANHFNAILEDKILITLDEAFWSGDKSVEGILKNVITGKKRTITYKGAQSYVADVYDRIVIIGNEEWLVPATGDERRFAVFNVTNGRRNDRTFFKSILKGMREHRGAELLMRFFMDYDLSTVDIDAAPETEGLNEQKDISLPVFERWWKNCLEEERIVGSHIVGWPGGIRVSDFYDAFVKETKAHRPPSKILVGKILQKLSPTTLRKVDRDGETTARFLYLPPIDFARMEFDTYIGFTVKWD